MKLSEIMIVPEQNFPSEKIKEYFSLASDAGKFPYAQFETRYLNSNGELLIFLHQNEEIAAFTGFKQLSQTTVQGKNAQVFSDCKGQGLVAKIYKFVNHDLKKTILSDIMQSSSGANLWKKTLPSIGITPKIFDTEDEYIIDPNAYPEMFNEILSKVYQDESSDEKFKYCWIIENDRRLIENNLLYENKLLFPIKGIIPKPI